jgi:SAM-dependent methyltransferase
MNEVKKIKERYEARKKNEKRLDKGSACFERLHRKEKEQQFLKILQHRFQHGFGSLTFLEIGAGTGKNLPFFLEAGFLPEKIWANELLADRFKLLQQNFPEIHLHMGDARDLPESVKFDIILQSTVFTSILDKRFKLELGQKLFGLLKPGGVLLWYDFMYDNPRNKDVKGVGKEIRSIFSEAKSITFTRTTLAPPLGRRVYGMYQLINFMFPFLRTHLVAEIRK